MHATVRSVHATTQTRDMCAVRGIGSSTFDPCCTALLYGFVPVFFCLFRTVADHRCNSQLLRNGLELSQSPGFPSSSAA